MTDQPIYKQGHVYTVRSSLYRISPDRCCHAVHEGGRGVGFYQCQNKIRVTRLVADIDRHGEYRNEPTERGYCMTHDPVKVAERERKRAEKYAAAQREADAKRNRQRNERDFRDACVKAIREIAAGHNDARGLAMDVLKKDPDA